MRGISLFLCALISTACGSDAASSQTKACNAHYDCPARQSCGTNDGTTFFCAASGPGQAGESCNANQSLPLQCDDHLFCLGMNDVGHCQRWCSPSDPCPSGSCQMVTTTHGAMLGFCPLPPPPQFSDTCNLHYDCPAGQTCGTSNGTTFLCAASGPGKDGDSCDAAQFLPLQCEDHLGCIGVEGIGTCHRWCGPNDACPSGAGSCQMATTSLGAMVGVCF